MVGALEGGGVGGGVEVGEDGLPGVGLLAAIVVQGDVGASGEEPGLGGVGGAVAQQDEVIEHGGLGDFDALDGVGAGVLHGDGCGLVRPGGCLDEVAGVLGEVDGDGGCDGVSGSDDVGDFVGVGRDAGLGAGGVDEHAVGTEGDDDVCASDVRDRVGGALRAGDTGSAGGFHLVGSDHTGPHETGHVEFLGIDHDRDVGGGGRTDDCLRHAWGDHAFVVVRDDDRIIRAGVRVNLRNERVQGRVGYGGVFFVQAHDVLPAGQEPGLDRGVVPVRSDQPVTDPGLGEQPTTRGAGLV